MISLAQLQSFADRSIAYINEETIHINDTALLVPDDKLAVKRLKDKSGIVMMVRFPQTDTKISSYDNFSEENLMLIYIIEAWSDGNFTEQEETDRFDYLQSLMKLAKTYIMDNHNLMRADIEKGFRTEFEYQQFGNWNGVSVSFSLKDYEL
ncbi:MAG: hypothetical protein WCJ03_03195 [Bacteroidales bacterium]